VTSKFLYPIAVAVSAITTLLTPYLIKSADAIVARFDRMAPRVVVNTLELYTSWVGRLGQRHANMATKLTRRWLWQMELNAALIAAVFVAASFVGQHPPAALKRVGLPDEWLRPALWLAATILSFPMIIATARKLQALGLLISETKVTGTNQERTKAIRSIVAQVVPMAGTTILGLYVLVLSSALLPSFKIFLLLLLLAALVSWFLRRSFIRVYSKAQVDEQPDRELAYLRQPHALQETFAQEAEPGHDTAPGALPSVLRGAGLETVTIDPGSQAVGKLIGELQLRSRTGASIVGIERRGVAIVNPGPDEELQVADQVLLLGTRAQIESARATLLKAQSA
jgi:CPA2 family monovalent cation:H+ antiporter-2